MSDPKFVPIKSLTGYTHQSYTLPATAITLTVANGARGILMQALTQNIRFTMDGTEPTAAIGFQLKAGDPPLFVELDSRITLKFMRETSGAVLEFEFAASE